jgi:crotonobetainyl-CoA:carnitine CoA-transferase CaiB-like acyl-CoA transferase
MTLGILARERSGEGQSLESSMIVSNLYHNYRDAQSYLGVSLRPVVDHFQYGTGATYRLYECAPIGADDPQPSATANPDPRWVFLAAVEDDEFAGFCAVAGRDDLAADPRFATRDARAEHRDELSGILEGIFLGRSAPEWEARCLEAGVGCAMADGTSHYAFVYTDPQALAIGLMTEAHHPSFGGKYYRHKPLVDLSATPGPVRSFCELGEYTRPLLRELGYDEATMAELADAQVVSWPGDRSSDAATEMVDTKQSGA